MLQSLFIICSVLELLSDLTKHPKLAIQAQQAIDRILDSNLSAKYWQCGELKHSDIIKDGFFDAGQVAIDRCYILDNDP